LKQIIYILLINIIFAIGGNNPWAVFNIASNANDFSLAAANISEGTKGFYQFSNPALLPNIDKKTFGASYTMMSLDRSSQSLSLNIPLPPKAAVAISMMRSGTSDIQGRDVYNNNTELFSHYEILGLISFGVSFSKYFSGGLNIKASYSNLDNLFGENNEASYSIKNNGIGFDGGFLFNYSKFSFGLKLENLASSKNWDLNISEQGNSYEEVIPTIYKIGGHYKINDHFTMFICSDNSLNNLLINKYALKIENIFDNVGIRAGATIFSKSQIVPVLGLYYSKRIFDLNYGVDFGSVNEGISHIFTWKFTL